MRKSAKSLNFITPLLENYNIYIEFIYYQNIKLIFINYSKQIYNIFNSFIINFFFLIDIKNNFKNDYNKLFLKFFSYVK